MAKTSVKATPVLQLENIARWYGQGDAKVDVLQNVSLTIPQGKSVAIVGPSGSGKSTLLHVAGLLDRPDGGQILVNGTNAATRTDDQTAALRNATCGFVYQSHHLLREFTALENVLMPALIGGGKPDKQRAENLLQSVGLGHRLHHHPFQMSGGEQQRTAIARALMNKPQILFADEPTGNLDPHTAEDVVNLLFNLIKTEGMSALIVTHNMELARRCHHVYRMDGGHLTQA